MGRPWIPGEVARVDPQFNRVVTTIDVASRTPPGGSVAVEDGMVWAAFGDSTLARIDPAQSGPPEFGVAGALPSALVVANGAVWVANAGDSNVQRFNPATFQEGAVGTISVGSRPTAIGFGEGALWVANTSDDSIDRDRSDELGDSDDRSGRRPGRSRRRRGSGLGGERVRPDDLTRRSDDEPGRRDDRRGERACQASRSAAASSG